MMRTRRVAILVAVVAVAVAAGLVLLRRPAPARPDRTPEGPAQARVPAEVPPAAGPSQPPAEVAPALEPPPAEETGTAPAPPAGVPEPAALRGEAVRLRGDQILASVNGVGITGKDVAPFRPTAMGQEISISPAMLQARVARAIERELTFQAARSRGVEIAEDEVANLLARIRPDQGGKYLLGDRDAVIEQELRDAKAVLLEQKLLVGEGVFPHVTEAQVEAHYRANAGQYEPLPEDPAERAAVWQRIDSEIRSVLAPAVRDDYQAVRAAFFGELNSQADIKLYLPDGME